MGKHGEHHNAMIIIKNLINEKLRSIPCSGLDQRCSHKLIQLFTNQRLVSVPYNGLDQGCFHSYSTHN